MASLKMALTLLFLHSIVELVHCASLRWISLPYTAPLGHPVTKFPCHRHTTVAGINLNNYNTENKKYVETIQNSNELSTQAQKFKLIATPADKSMTAASQNSNTSKQLSALFLFDYTDCELLTNGNLSSWRGYNISLNLTLQTTHYHSIVHISANLSSIKLKFHNDNYFGSIFENQPSGTSVRGLHNLTVVADLKTTSLDILPEHIHYRILRPQNARKTFDLKVLPDETVGVFSKMSLDREKRSYYQFLIEAIGPQGSFATTNIRVDVSDRNDSPPVMKKKKYITMINENTPVGTPIVQVSAHDPDNSNSRITYSIEKHKHTNHFAINPSSGFIYVTKSLYQNMDLPLLKVHATDDTGHRSRPSLVKIGLYGKRVNPIRHMSNPTHLWVPLGDDAASYSSIVQVRRRRASVPQKSFVIYETDTGSLFNVSVQDPTYAYSLLTDTSGWFTVDSTSGIVSVLPGKNIDADLYQNVVLSFNITNGAKSLIHQVTVNIMKHKPYFLNRPKPLKAVVTTTMKAGALVYTLRSQSDNPGNIIKYRMTDPNKYFELNKDTGDITILWKDKLVLNRYYPLEVYAVDVSVTPNLVTGPETLEVFYGALPPQFFQSSYSGSVFENNQANQEIENLSIAVKSFSGKNINFALTTIANIATTDFEIRKKPGKDAEASVFVMKTFFFKVSNVFNLIILASDSTLTSSVPLTVHIIDVNSEPSFNIQEYRSLPINEDVAVGTEIKKTDLKIIAIDRDAGKNAEIVFNVTDDHFEVKRNKIADGQYEAILVVRKPLDYEKQPIHKFIITASDLGDPPKSATANVEVHLKNVNNKSPNIPENSTFHVNERAPVNTFVAKLKVTDPDKDNVCFYFGNFKNTYEMFAIDKRLGIITVRSDLSNAKEMYVINITATDEQCCCEKSPPHTSYGSITIYVEDVNNNKPKFSECSSYNTSIKEDISLNSFIIQVKAEDKDRGKNGEITYTLIESSTEKLPFQIGSESGNITVKKSLLDQHGIYNILVKATDNGASKLYDLCLLTINVLDVNNNAPKFDQAEYLHIEQKTIPVGQPVFTVQATDADEGKNADIYYNISSEYFSIDQNGIITVSKPLTNYTGDSIDLTVNAFDKGAKPLSSSVTVKIQFQSNLTNVPSWLNQTGLVIKVREDQDRNVPFAYLLAESNIPDKTLTFCLTDCRKTFENFKIHGEDNKMLIALREQLDYETKTSYQIWAKVMNQHVPTPLQKEIRFTIEVLDTNDNTPIFDKFDTTQGVYIGYISENMNVSTSVIQIFVSDKDPTPEFRNISLSLKNDTFFSIDKNGVIRTRKVFDREKQEYYFIQVIAVDSANKSNQNKETRNVKIQITDVNDVKPHFEKDFYTFRVPENVQNGNPVFTLTAKDEDDPSSGRLEYSLRDNIFTADNYDGIIRVLNNKLLDYETQPHVLNLTYYVSDGIFEANTTIQVIIEDVNDNNPEFTEKVYEVKGIVEENKTTTSTNKMYLLTLTATDPDKDRNNSITYHLAGGAREKSAFEIESKTGDLYLLKALDRDFGTGGSDIYSLSVFAIDEPGTKNERKGFAIVDVYLKDINDNAPIFATDTVGYVPENSPKGTEIMKAVVKDYDSGLNSKIEYSIVQQPLLNGIPYFSIDQKGTISVNNPVLDRETQNQFQIRVKAKDGGTPSLSSERKFIIHITDKNDNPPKFICNGLNTKISENQPVNVRLITIQALDKDDGVNADLQYYIDSKGKENHFKIEADNRNRLAYISLQKPLDYEDSSLRNFDLTVRVQDPDPTHVDTCTISITVTDYNDNSPIFTPQRHELTIPENEKMVPIYTFAVSDADSGNNQIVNFMIERKSNPKKQFSVKKVNTNAVISIRKTLDREDIPSYTLIILGVDEGNPPQTGTATLTVNLSDVNDNYPIFKENYRPIVWENSPPKKDFQLIEAKDRDEGKNGPPFTFVYTCRGSNYDLCKDFAMTFDKSAQVGKISSLRKFDREVKKYYDMPIEMADSGIPPMKGINYLRIEIGDVNDNKHRPGAKEILVYNYKGLFGNFPIGRVYCEDLDDWDNDDKTYTFLGNVTLAGYFKLLSNGTIIMAKGVPEKEYFFQASVYDKYFKNTEVCNVTVKIISVSEEAVRRSGSTRFKDVTPSEFIEERSNGSAYNKFKSQLATILGVPVANVDIFSLMENEIGHTDVRYSAHNSPWYTPGMTDGAVAVNRAKIATEVGYQIDMVGINKCIDEYCDAGGCTNKLIIKDTPVLINSSSTGMIGVNTRVEADCICGARDFSQPVQCTPDYCYNGGVCEKDYFQVVKCVCPPGFTGPRCQVTGISFEAKGYALFSPLEQCENSRTSLEFVTLQNGLLFYNGPVTNKPANSERDFILLELINGYPQLKIDHGTGELILSLNGKDKANKLIIQKVNDGKWHRVDIIRNKREVRLILDHCFEAEAGDRSPCEVKGTTPDENIYLNTVDPLQIGGIYMETSSINYPKFTFDSFKGCIKNFIHNSQIYDLQVSRRESFSKNAQVGCSRTEEHCLDKCSGNSICISDFNGNYQCVCNAGYQGKICDKKTTVKDFKSDSFITWEFKNSFYNNKINNFKNEMQVSFRTRETNGLLFKVPSSNPNNFMQLEILNKKACLGYNFGQTSSLHYLCLDYVDVNDGQWHTLKMKRVKEEIQLMMDGGEGRFYNDIFVKTFKTLTFTPNKVDFAAGAEIVIQNAITKIKSKDFKNSCMNDIRYDDAWLPMQQSETNSEAATVKQIRNVADDCIRDDCKGVTCGVLQTCIPLFGKYSCICNKGYKKSLSKCVDIDECQDPKCFGNATCLNTNGTFKCLCPKYWTGELCNLADPSPVIGNNTLATGALVTILVCIFIILIIVLLVLLFKRNKKAGDKFVLEVDSDDDIRENVISYDEEGAGEEDQLAYDISRLRKAEPTLKPVIDKPVRSYNPDGDRPEVGSYIDNLIKEADNDDVAPPYDSVREFVYEGADSDVGSLSSLNTSSGSEGDNDYDALNEWGPKFAKLADMYGGGGE
ncbi:putative neural-cadherin 2 [Octopus sinensis]|uniref:Neural-cadherin 2 n=1 Tax=Octopus sinensis TaxID=2607531 RepID=A0A6P7SCJ6_9MOLL|nr:putative neural-cadherin 2 [Octopus sinensis]